MSRYAFNYNLTNILNNYSKEPVMNIGDRTALSFLEKDYIHEDKFKRCKNYSDKEVLNISECISKLEPNSVVIYSEKPLILDEFKCTKYTANRTSRNPFNLRKRIFHICNKSKT